MDKLEGNAIATKRKEHKLTQEELAQKIHVTRQSVSAWENNKNIPDRVTLERIAQVFGVSVEQLFTTNAHKRGDLQMSDNLYQPNNKDTAIGLFYACSFFIGIFIAVLFLFLNPITMGNVIFAAIFGVITFLVLGLFMHGIIVLIKK